MNYYNKSKKYSRMFYKATGYKNPMKKGKLSSTRITRQLPKLARDINILKSIINSEKKRLTLSNRDMNIGQLANATGSGHWLIDMTPNPSQGLGYQNKIGSSIKLHSTHFDFQFTGQTSTISAIKLKIEVIKVEGLPYSNVQDIMGKYILPNNFLTGGSIYDVSSARDPDYFKNFRVLKRRYITLPADQMTGDVPLRQVSMGLKYKNHHVRNNDNDPTLSQGQILILITADRGNAGSVLSTVGGAAITTPNTGVRFGYDITHYFYDN